MLWQVVKTVINRTNKFIYVKQTLVTFISLIPHLEKLRDLSFSHIGLGLVETSHFLKEILLLNSTEDTRRSNLKHHNHAYSITHFVYAHAVVVILYLGWHLLHCVLSFCYSATRGIAHILRETTHFCSIVNVFCSPEDVRCLGENLLAFQFVIV